nr:MAG TPA: terminase large subunit [Caudoviricetes sp.]
MLQTSVIYKANYEAKEKVLVNQGGTSSGKTYSIIQVLFTLSILFPMSVTTVVGQDIPNLKKGAYRDAKNIYNSTDELQKWFDKPNETDRLFTCRNGSIIEFSSFKDAQDAKSGKRDYLFINEADGLSYDIYWQLALRTRRKIFIDYNPSARFWVHENLIGKPNVKLIISDHRHNPFLSEEQHKEIEGITDTELFKVYARGKTGKITGLIFNNWDIVDAMPDIYKLRCTGIDFGFVNDPTAIIDVRFSNGDLWLDEVAYCRGMLNEDIYDVYCKYIGKGIKCVADSAEPKSIAELKDMGLQIEASEKGKDSIRIGIDILKRYKWHITRRSVNIRRELLAYKWKIDRDGIPLNEPVDYMNHALDAIRYVALNKLRVRQLARGATLRLTSF